MGILMETTEVNLGTASYRRRAVQPQIFGTMGAPYAETVHTIAINTRETEFGSIVEPIMLKTYKHFQAGNGYRYPQQMVTPVPLVPESPSTSNGVKEEPRDTPMVTRPPPKKKWIKEYLEEEPQSPVAVRAGGPNGVPPPSPPTPAPPSPAASIDYQEHSRPRTTSATHGPAQIPSPPSVGSSGSNGSGSSGGARAGTREVHNKLEKNRRAHLKECFELLKRQLPAAPDDKKTSNLSILGSAIRYIQVLRRKERECEHEMERLAREKIAAQQRLAALKRDVPPRAALRTRTHDGVSEERDESVNGPVVGIPISITSSPPRVAHLEPSPPHTLNLSTKLRSLPIQITPTTSQMLRTAYAARHNTLTLATLAPAETTTAQNGPVENGVPSALSTALVHPAQIHLPLSQVVGGGGLVVGGALQLLGGAPLRVLQPKRNGMTAVENKRIPKENGLVSPPPATGGVVVSGLSPLVVSPGGGAHLLHTHTLAHKMVETQVVKGSPLTVSAQYLSATTIVKPMVVVSGAPSPPAPST